MRESRKKLLALTLTFSSFLSIFGEKNVKLSRVGDGYAATSVNTAIFRANSLTTHGDTQYICYYDPDGYVTLGKRTLDSDEWQTKRTQYKGNVTDGHNVISMAVDGEGYIHVSFDHHGDKLHYARSIQPGSLELGDLEPMTGNLENDVTYPEFHNMPDGGLLFAYRSGASGSGNMVINRYDTTTRMWSRVHDSLIDGEGARNAYWQMYADQFGTLHLSWVWRETWLVETNHDICYARSKDGGLSWQRSNGEPYQLPITESTAEVVWKVPQKSELINQTSMTADPLGNPLIATYWRDSVSAIPQYRLVYHNGEKWKMEQVSKRVTPFSLSGGGTKMIPMSRPRIISDGKHYYYIFRDAERGSVVSMAKKSVDSAEWVVKDLTDFSVSAWEPTIDNELWRNTKRLHIFVQNSLQGDGEKVTTAAPQHVYVANCVIEDCP